MIKDKHVTPPDNNISQPLVVYDGDCGFCVYSVKYWQKLTGTSVGYQPYQAVATDYPHISVEEFKRAVQYITPDGKVVSGAEASFMALSHSRSQADRVWMTLYRWLPGFAYCSNKAYQVISTHREFAYRWSIRLWGRDPAPPTYDLLTWVFLRLFGLTFLAAFYSFTTQALGLVGSHGIVPVTDFLNAVYAQAGAWSYWYVPVLFWFNSSDVMINAVGYAGIALSVLLILNIWPRFCLLGLYVLYLSLIYAGQVFMTFQWDMLLLETAIIAFFLVRFRVLGIWLLRWLVFRYILASGLVKIMSGDPSWWNFTALDYHFLTQPLPTPLAWYAYYLPPIILMLLTGASLLIELVLPFLIFCPRRLRFITAFGVLAMQAGIMLTGNYNFFNITSVILCLSLFDDAALSVLIPSRLRQYLSQPRMPKPPYKFTVILAGVFTVVSVVISLAQFNLKFIGASPRASVAIGYLLAPLQMVNTYGPFAVMTKKRYEIIIEASVDGEEWREYNFKYKPGDIYRRPVWNIPFQPRLDWQLWFAALAPLEGSPWFVGFMKRLLENEPTVLALMDGNPFPDAPPQYVRAWFYDYTYTTAAQYQQTGAWWNRKLADVYLPIVSLNNFRR
jgi:predicted DCC family thiol-disulfide oxidoreductase YuxK